MESLSKLLMFGCVYLAEEVWGVVLGQSLGGLGVLGGQLLAVTATTRVRDSKIQIILGDTESASGEE